jgi:FkbM family methyltransferase
MNIYLDCGTHLGEGISSHIVPWKITKDWKIVAFEANPETFKELKKLQEMSDLPEKLLWLKFENLELRNEAVWTQDTTLKFGCAKYSDLNNSHSAFIENFLDNHDALLRKRELIVDHVRSEKSIDGSSSIFFKEMSKFLKKNGDEVQKSINYVDIVDVKAINFSNYLMKNINERDEVYCKMDIERAEFPVLISLIRKKTIKKIKYLDIEWHNYDSLKLKILKVYILIWLKFYKIQVRDWK